MAKTAIYPGSFDPFTLGHKAIVDKSLDIFDEVIIAIGYNNKKHGFLPVAKRQALIEKVYHSNHRVKVISYEGLTSDYCREQKITHIVRGLRNIRDFEAEKEIALINTMLNSNLETVFLLTPSDTALISSSTIRELLELGGDPMQFMPKEINIEDLKA